MSDAFDKEGYYYEDSDFALDLNLQDVRRELVYLLEHDNARVDLNSCSQELRNLQGMPASRSKDPKYDDGLALNSSKQEFMNLQDVPAKDNRSLKCYDGLALHSHDQVVINIEAVPSQSNLFQTDDSLVDPGLNRATSKPEDTLAPPDPSDLPLPIWASSDQVGNWLERSMADFTIKYYTDSVQEFFKHFDVKNKKT